MCKLPIDGYAIQRDETSLYTIDAEDQPHIVRIRGVYMFNRNEQHHAGELTPSYWLIHLYDVVIFVDEPLSEVEIDAIKEKYETYCGHCIYVHCHEIDRLIESNDQTRIYHYGATGVSYEDEDYDDQMQQLESHFHEDSPF